MNVEVKAFASAAEGGCLCGAVRYSVAPGVIMESGYCHCRTCQRQSGAPAVAWFAVEASLLSLRRGTPSGHRASTHATREFWRD